MPTKYRVVQVAQSGRRFPASSTITALAAVRSLKRAVEADNPERAYSIDIYIDGRWEAYE